MSRVYEVEHRELRRRLAMKLSLEPERGELDDRLRLEAQALAQLRHPGLLSVSDLGRTRAGRVFVVSELLVGRNLAEILRAEGRIEPSRAVGWVAQALRALAVVHRAGVVHRDLKLENLFLAEADEGAPRVKVLDFGIAKLLAGRALTVDSLEAPTADGTILGTPAYLAPEQVTGQAVDARADLYAMGVVLYALVCGRAPFLGDDPVEVARAHAFEVPPPPSRFASLPPALEQAMLRALAKRPSDRPAHAEAMARALEAALEAPHADLGAPPLRRGADAITASTAPERARAAVDRPEDPQLSPIEDTRSALRVRRIEGLAMGVAIVSAFAVVALVWRLLMRD